MNKLKDRFEKWKQGKWYQKAGDVIFWMLLISLIIPGSRKYVATGVNQILMQFRSPSISLEKNTYKLSDADYQWDIIDASGNNLRPEGLKDEVIFLNFWGTYCPPCIAEMPKIQALYNDYKDRVKFILVSGESPEKVDGFLNRNAYNFPAYYGGRSMPKAFSVHSIPTTFIISRDGRIVTQKIGAANWNSKAMRKVFEDLLK